MLGRDGAGAFSAPARGECSPRGAVCLRDVYCCCMTTAAVVVAVACPLRAPGTRQA
jgi:hypothetical protein